MTSRDLKSACDRMALADLYAEKDRLLSELCRMNSDLKASEHTVSVLTDRCVELQKEITRLKEELRDERDANSYRSRSAEKEIETLRGENKTLRSENARLRVEHDPYAAKDETERNAPPYEECDLAILKGDCNSAAKRKD